MAVNCAGPFQRFEGALVEACLEVGLPVVDIADNRDYIARMRGLDARFRGCDTAAVYGCSSLPGISGALALTLMEARGGRTPDRARVTVYVGNRNPKGLAAISSLLEGLGRPISTPQGTVHGFRDREIVPLPPPFGPRAAYNFDGPDHDLLPAVTGVTSVAVKLGMESDFAMRMFALLAALDRRYGPRFARILELGARPLGFSGSSGGAVMTELFFPDGTTRRATLLSRNDGQKMAVFPAVLVAVALARGTSSFVGVGTAYDVLGADRLLDLMVEAGFERVIEKV